MDGNGRARPAVAIATTRDNDDEGYRSNRRDRTSIKGGRSGRGTKETERDGTAMQSNGTSATNVADAMEAKAVVLHDCSDLDDLDSILEEAAELERMMREQDEEEQPGSGTYTVKFAPLRETAQEGSFEQDLDGLTAAPRNAAGSSLTSTEEAQEI